MNGYQDLNNALRKPLQGIDVIQPLNGLGALFMSGRKIILEILVNSRHKLLRSDDPAVGKVPGAITESIDRAQGHTFIQIRLICHETALFVNKSPGMGNPVFHTLYREFPKAKIRGEKSVAVAGLGMITKRTPTIFLRFLHDPPTVEFRSI